MAADVLSLQSETHSPNVPSSRRKPGSSLCTEGRSVRYDETSATVRTEPVEAPSPFDAPEEVPLGDKLRANAIRSAIAAQSFAFCLALCLALLSPFPANAALNERTLDTGAIRLIFGKTQAGFIDEAFLDRNGDGTYTPDELIVKQAPDQPAVVVTYIVEPGATDPGAQLGVLTGRSITGKPAIDRIDISDLKANIKGHLVFDTLGSAPFEVTLQGKRNSAVLTVDWAFAPLRNAPGLWLKEASLRVQGVFDTRDPGVSRRSMSTGDFRNTPRPDSPYQPLVWQLGGHLVESPWYWRNWLAWSESSGPATVQEGAVPPKTLEFFLRDDRQGIQAMAVEPAGAAPFELAGNGLPSTLSLNAWSPRVPPLPMRADLPARFEIKGMGLQFFRTGLEDLFNKGDAYWKKASGILATSRDELARELSPLRSNLRTPGLNATQVQQRLAELAASPVRGWDANIRDTPLDSGGKPRAAERPDSGPGWLDITLDSAPTGDHPASATPWPLPVKGGIPFPRSVLRSVDQLRLVNARGEELPIQADQLAMWPDGSVKWVLITLLADGGADAAPPLSLEYGDRVTRKAAIPGRLEIKPLPDGLSVDTGSLHFQLTKRMSGVFDSLSLRNGDQTPQAIIPSTNTERLNRMDLLALASPARYAPYAFHAEGAQAEPSRAEIESVEIERQGPLVANLLVKGRYHYKTLGRGRGNKDAPYRNEGCEFWIRYTVYAGQPYVEVKHSFVFEGNPDLEMIQDLSLHIPVDLSGQTTFTVGADGKPMVIPNAKRAGIFQDNAEAAEIWSTPEETQKHSSPRRTPGSSSLNFLDSGFRRNDEFARETTLAMAAKADGWSDVSDATKGVTFGVRDMREMYAKELAFEDGHLNIGLWPKRARLLDTRRYSRQYVDGESTSYGQGAAQGVSRSHDLFFYFHADDAASAGSATMAARLLKPAILKAQPAWYANSEAAGAFRPRDSRTYAPWERMISDGIDYFFYHRELWSWFGIYDYGDLQQVPNGRGGWQRLSGRWGWVNNEALVDMLFYEQFMRTGQSEYLDAALAMTHHTQEVDLINSHDYKGNRAVKMHGHRHNVDHWGDGYVGIRGAAPQGFRLGYYLTGDLRIYDQLRMGMDAHWSSMNSYDKEHSSGLGYLSFFWEATGDPLYRDALKAYLDFQTAHFAKFGHIHGGVWDFKKDINRPLPAEPVSESPIGFFFQDFGSAYSLMELADLTGRADLTKALVQFARDTIRQRGNTWEALYCHYRLMAFAYRHTGDPVFLRYATDHADKLSVSPNRRAWATSSAIDSFDNKLSMLAWTGQGLPYLMRAMDERAKDPVVTFNIPVVLPVPRGKTNASLPVDASETRARDGTLAGLEWQVDEHTASRKPSDTLTLAPGKHQITLLATDSAKRSATASKTITVWDPGVVARLCFRGQIDGFAGGEYSDEKGYGFTKGTRLIDSSEPQRHKKMGCPEVLMTGGVRVKTGPGRFEVEMGGTDFWTETMGKVSLQGSPLDVTITKEASKKLSWSYSGEVTVGADGLLNMDFAPSAKGEPVVLAYVIVREKR